MRGVVQPLRPEESPGPIPSVVERFRPSRERVERPSGPEAEVARFAVVLVPPDAAEPLGFDRADTGLKLYLDDEWDCDVSSLDDAVALIHDEVGVPVALVEHRADLSYWTARVHPEGPALVEVQPSRSA